jgi:hypothetical protein
LFGAEELSANRFAAIRDEAVGAGIMAARRDRFASLDSVRELLLDLIPDLAEPATLDQYLLILNHCFFFWEAGCRHYAFEQSAVRSVINTPPDLSGWLPRSPCPSLYLELPQNLFWAAVVEGEPPEPAEGMFASLRGDPAAEEADILLVLGVRPDRPGFSVAELEADLTAARDIGAPDAFASDLPGADLANLYSLQRPAEVVLLLLRLLWYADTYPESIEQEQRVSAADHGAAGQATATMLDYYRVRPVERSRG